MAKWASRFALGLSNSVPGIKLKPENLFFIRDTSALSFYPGFDALIKFSQIHLPSAERTRCQVNK